jgi:hypothetical protein
MDVRVVGRGKATTGLRQASTIAAHMASTTRGALTMVLSTMSQAIEGRRWQAHNRQAEGMLRTA